MIDPKELRIGNLLYVYPKKIISVVEIGATSVLNKGDETEEPFNYDEIEPIPITSEILDQCKIKGKHFCDEFFIETNMSGVLIGHRPHGVKYLRNIKHLHQFQNLHYALTGEELYINFDH